ncbi:hypothetical protein Tco_1399877 [Tanacetum coccineum]
MSIPRKSTRKRQKLEEDAEKEELKGLLDIIPREEVPIEVESISTKFPIVDWKTYVLTETFMYYQVFRGDGSSKNYKILSEMLEDFDRQDVEELYRLVKERYSTSRPEGFDLMLWGDLHTLFDPDEDDEIWKDQHEYKLEEVIPLSQELLTKKVEVEKLEIDRRVHKRHLNSKVYKILKCRNSAYTLVYIQKKSDQAGINIKFKAEQEQERLDHETAMKIQEELDAAERQRMAQVHQAAQGFTNDEWDDILARVHVTKTKKFFAQQRAEAKRNKLMTPAQQKEYMSTYIKNQEGGYTLKQLKALSFEEVKEILKQL